MGASGKDKLRFEMFEQDYRMLSNETRSKITPMSIDVEDVEYNDELESELKKESYKAYKKWKARQHELRHKK